MDRVVRELLEQMPDFRKWNAVDPTANDWYGYEYHRSRIGQAIYLSDLFWPTFVERDGLILRLIPDPSSDLEKSLRGCQEAGWTPRQIEYVLNHVHIDDRFLSDPDRDRLQSGAYGYLARVIAEMWRCRLRMLFPHRELVVETQDDDQSVEVYAFSVREP